MYIDGHYNNRDAYNRSKERRRKLLDSLKNGPCSDCGQTFDPVCMDFDHIPGEIKSSEVSGLTIAQLASEAALCELVCANCHRLRTKARGFVGAGRPKSQKNKSH